MLLLLWLLPPLVMLVVVAIAGRRYVRRRPAEYVSHRVMQAVVLRPPSPCWADDVMVTVRTSRVSWQAEKRDWLARSSWVLAQAQRLFARGIAARPSPPRRLVGAAASEPRGEGGGGV